MNLKTSPALFLSIFICIYLVAGIYTELIFLQKKPLPEKLLSDYRLYQSAHSRVTDGGTLYDGVFLYPPPSLLLVGLFGRISNTILQYAIYLAVNLIMISLLVYGVSRFFGLQFEQIWYWYPLAFGYGPLLESLHYGQINVIVAFGVFLLFYASESRPLLSGLGLSLAIVMKSSPIVFIWYLGLTRQYKILGWTFLFLVLLTGAAVMRYGWEPFYQYPQAVLELTQKHVIDVNTFSLVAKLGTLDRTDLMNWPPAQPVIDFLQPVQIFASENPAQVQRGLLVYFILILTISGLLAYWYNQRLEFFIITALSVLLYPNVIWYHHFVFLLLPLLIWMANTQLNTRVVAWCLFGLLVAQFDRWHLTNGLLIHLFGHATIWIIIGGQIRSRFSSPGLKS